jgi:hypothetical protein
MPASSKEEALRELGRMAREKRENARLSLENIYERTRIRLEYLQGIEDGNYQGFPDLVYTKGFVRTYLSVVGAEDIKDDFIMWLSKDGTKERHLPPPTNILGNGTSPTKGFKPASHLWLFAVLLLALLGSGGYVWYSWGGNPFVLDLGRFRADLPFEGKEEASEETAAGEISSQDLPALISPDNVVLAILPTSESLAPEPEPETAAPSLRIRAVGDVWTRVIIGGKTVFSKTMKSGDEASWELTGEARVTYGRPNMAEVTLNGKDLGLVNPRGSKTSETYFYALDGTYRKSQ